MDAYERRCRLLLRAYPARYRESRGEEVLGTLLDTAEPGRSTPPLRDAWDTARGGLATRRREHPPLAPWLAYRMGYRALPERWRMWARDDIRSRAYPLLRLAPVFLFWLPFVTIVPRVWTLPGAPGWDEWVQWAIPLFLVWVTVFTFMTVNGTREQELTKHGLGSSAGSCGSDDSGRPPASP